MRYGYAVQVDLVGQRRPDQPETHKTQIHKNVSRWKMGKRIHLKSGLVWVSDVREPANNPLFST